MSAQSRTGTDPTLLDPLVSPFGPVSGVWDPRRRLPVGFATGTCSIGGGQPGHALPHDDQILAGGMTWESAEMARFIAIAEGAERYTGTDVLGEPRIWATANELEGECLEPWRYPRCSEREHAHPKCPMTRFDPARPIRWSRGVDLVSGELTWVPAVMGCYGLHDAVPAESFTYRISTGYAVHTDPIEAVVRGIYEVVERDMVALTWLQRLPLPLLGAEYFSENVSQMIEWNRRRFVETYLFNATSDLQIPTVYCLVSADHAARGVRLISAATGGNLTRAAEKALSEMVGLSESKHEVQEIRENFEDFRDLADGAHYMGVPERAGAFDFLLDGADNRRPGNGPILPDNPRQALVKLITIFAGAGMRPVALDRTTSELADVGLTSVSVVIPDLQPMSLHPLAQFKGHSRLYTAPALMGYPVRTEEELCLWPIPFD